MKFPRAIPPTHSCADYCVTCYGLPLADDAEADAEFRATRHLFSFAGGGQRRVPSLSPSPGSRPLRSQPAPSTVAGDPPVAVPVSGPAAAAGGTSGPYDPQGDER